MIIGKNYVERKREKKRTNKIQDEIFRTTYKLRKLNCIFQSYSEYFTVSTNL